jgi:hypothetical protein
VDEIDPYEQYYVFTDVMAFAPIEDDGTCPLIDWDYHADYIAQRRDLEFAKK